MNEQYIIVRALTKIYDLITEERSKTIMINVCSVFLQQEHVHDL